MPQLTMLYTRKGTEDGITVKEYHKGVTYTIAPSLARAFLAAGFAVPARHTALAKAVPYSVNRFAKRPFFTCSKRKVSSRVHVVRRKLVQH